MGTTLSTVCFGVLGALVARHIGPTALVVALGVAGGLIFGKVLAMVLGGIVWASNASVRSEPGGVARALSDGVVVLIPFTILAALAELYLGWSAVQSFASAGIMASSAGVGAAAARSGGGWRTVALPAVGGMILSAAWMAACVLSATLIRGAGLG